jgi:hypothetical protein
MSDAHGSRLPREIAKLAVTVTRQFPAGVVWAVTCGSALALNGIDHRPTDLDIFAPVRDARRLWDSLQGLPEVFSYHAHIENGITSDWGRYKIDGIELDIVGDFTVRRLGLLFQWKTFHPCWTYLRTYEIDSVAIPYFRLEDLLLLYMALPDEEQKLAGIVAKLRATRLDRDYLSLITNGNPVLEAYVAKVLSVED